jgi:hypothetical protein
VSQYLQYWRKHIQHTEQKQIYCILIRNQIIGYFRYVGDIFIIYDQRKTNIEGNLTEFNKQQTNIKFKIDKDVTVDCKERKASA